MGTTKVQRSIFEDDSEGSGLDWNRHQQEIFDWTRDAARGEARKPHAQIRARAGTGKTTTALEMAKIISEESPGAEALFCSFSRGISEEIADELEGTDFNARTIHSVGYGVLRKQVKVSQRQFEINRWKYLDLIDDWASVNYRDYGKDGWYQEKWDMHNVVDLCRGMLIDPEDEDALAEVANLAGVALGSWQKGVSDVIERGQDMVRKMGRLDFTDMVYYPIQEGLFFPSFDWIIIDEAQDLNPAQQKMAHRMIANSGHSVWIGDENQAIYQFQGAKPEGFLSIPNRYDAETFTLPISYRCPKSHIREANRIVSDIEAAPDAEEGTFKQSEASDFLDVVQAGDMVLGRRNAPIISRAVSLVESKRPAKVIGRDLAKKLKAIVDTVTDRMVDKSLFTDEGRERMNSKELADKDRPEDWAINYNLFPDTLEDWAKEKTRRLMNQGASDQEIEKVADQKRCIQACYRGFTDASCPAELKGRIETLFESDRDPVYLSTIHKAKGKEFERLHIIDTESLPMEFDWGRPPGEMNVKYVCLTRSSSYINVFGDLWSERDGVSIGDPLTGEEFTEASEDLKQKIAQLLQKANSTRFEPEAEAFRTKAEELLAEFDLTREDLRVDGFNLR